MSFLGRIFGAAAGETAKGLMEGAGSLAISIRSAITGEASPERRAELEALAIQADGLALQGQVAVNKIEAASGSLFIAGWRPFIGWICGISIGYHYLIYPNLIWYMTIWHSKIKPPPAMSLTELWPVILGMLGLGVYRSYEKSKGAQKNH